MVDADCNPLSIEDINPGDTVTYYYPKRQAGMANQTVSMLQTAEKSIPDSHQSKSYKDDINTDNECVTTSRQQIHDSKIQLFISVNTQTKRIATKPLLYKETSTSYLPYYNSTVFVDINCKKINIDSLKSGDELYFHITPDPSTSLGYKVSYIQKIN